MSEATTAEAELVNVDGVKIPAWAERTACVLAFRGVRVLAALRDAHTGRPALIIHPRSRQALPVNLHTAMGFASWVAAALRTMGFEALDEDAFDDAEVKPGNVHVRAEYDACADRARVHLRDGGCHAPAAGVGRDVAGVRCGRAAGVGGRGLNRPRGLEGA